MTPADQPVRTRSPLVTLVTVLPTLVVFLAATESVLVRLDHPWRPTEARLFLQTTVLWSVLGALALVPAWVTLRLRRRLFTGEPARLAVAFVLFSWMVLPIVAHASLDRFTGIGGDLVGLSSARPWLETLCFVLLAFGLLFGLRRALERFARPRWTVPFAALALVCGLFLPFGVRAAGATSSAAGKPNLLLMVWDTCRSDRLLAYDYERETSPHLAELAEDALVFENSRSVAIFTFTSHVSLLTGALPSTHGARLLATRYDPRKAMSIAATLQAAGYRTGAFVGTDVLAGRTGIRYGFDVYDDEVDPPVCDTYAWGLVHDLQALLASRIPALRNNGQPHWIQDFQRPASQVLARALRWIERDDERPWFVFVNLYDVHWPYVPEGEGGERLVRPYSGPMDGYLFRSDAWRKGYEPDAEDRRHLGDLYDAEIYDLDATVDDFLGKLDFADTALVLTADHGEAFGEAGVWKHEDIYEPQVRVPLIVRMPGSSPLSGRVKTPVTGVDVAPTLLGLAGLAPEGPIDGQDLVALARAGATERTVLVEDRDHIRPDDVRIALYLGPWKLVRRGLGADVRFALHDLRSDALGAVDVQAAFPEVFEDLKARLEVLRQDKDARDAEVQGELVDQADALRALGYAGE